jgi:heme exporter protein CcmD
MDLAADHVGYVLVSYGVSAVVLLAMCLWIIARDRALARKLKDK